MPTQRRKCRDFSLITTPPLWITLGVCLLVISLYVLSRPEVNRLSLGLLDILEARTLDWRFHLRGTRSPGNEIVIVAIDETTENALGRWQSSGRQWLAHLLPILTEGHALAVGCDLALAEPDPGSASAALETLRVAYQERLPQAVAQYPALLTYLEQTQTAHDYDQHFADALKQAGNVVLGMYFFFPGEKRAGLPDAERQQAIRQTLRDGAYNSHVPPLTAPAALRVSQADDVEANLPLFLKGAASWGHFNLFADRDGVIRHLPLLIGYERNYYPALALEVARIAHPTSLPPIVHSTGPEGQWSLEAIEWGNTHIPVDEEGKLLINYYGPGGPEAQTFQYYSLSEVIQGKIPPHKFADKIVLIGITSLVTRDVHATPFQAANYPGVEIHATVVANLLRSDFLLRPKAFILIEAPLILILALILAVVRHRHHPVWGVWAALLSLLVIIGSAYLLFVFGNLWLNVTFPALFILLDYLTITSYKYFTEEKQKRAIKQAFQYYVSPEIVEQMMQRVETLKLGGARKLLTAFFADIRGFTPISEKMAPEALVAFLNQYLSEMTQIVLKHEGTVDKYMGDAIMAFYGAPVAQPDHALCACKTAVDMLMRLKQLRVEWEAQGLPPLAIGIGINTGEMSVGNMGSKERFNYTIMGDHVNLASRLEGTTKYYGVSIIVSQNTLAACQDQGCDALTVRELDTVRVKGKAEPVVIYELLGYGSLYAGKQALIQKFGEGLQAYKSRRWEQACALFEEALALDSTDQPTRIYLERCAAYAQQPPPEDWDGVHEMTAK